MSIVDLTKDLSKFRFDYDSVGANNSQIGGRHGTPDNPIDNSDFDNGVGGPVEGGFQPQSFDDGRGNIVTGQQTFDRPAAKSLENMVSKFGPIQSEPESRGPYGLSDFMDGTKQGRGFIYPGGAPLGFTMDMESLEGGVIGQIAVEGDISLTPLSYTVAGIHSGLSNGQGSSVSINDLPNSDNPFIPNAFGYDFMSTPIGNVNSWSNQGLNLELPNNEGYTDTHNVWNINMTGPFSNEDYVRHISTTAWAPNAHGSNFMTTPILGIANSIYYDVENIPEVTSDTHNVSMINLSGPTSQVYQTQLDTIAKANGAHGSDFLSLPISSYESIYIDSDNNVMSIPPSVLGIGTTSEEFLSGVGAVGGNVNYYGSLGPITPRVSIYRTEEGEYQVPQGGGNTLPPGGTSEILQFTGTQITHNIPQINLTGPFTDTYDSTITDDDITPIALGAHGSVTVPIQSYTSQYSPDDDWFPSYASVHSDSIFHELGLEGTKEYGNFNSNFSVPFQHLSLNQNPFRYKYTTETFTGVDEIGQPIILTEFNTTSGWKIGSLHIGWEDTAGANWDDMTFPDSDRTREVYQHHFLSSPFTQIPVDTNLFGEDVEGRTWKDGSIHINADDIQGAPWPNSIFHQLGLTSGTYDNPLGFRGEILPAGTTTSGDKNYRVYNSIDNVTFANLSLGTNPFDDGWKDGSIHIPSDVTEAAAIGGGTIKFANLNRIFNQSSVYSDSTNEYTQPDEFIGIQRTFNVPAPYPNDMYNYSIATQFGYSAATPYISDGGTGELFDQFDWKSTDSELKGTALSAIFFQSVKDNRDWPYRGVGLGDNFRVLPIRTEKTEADVYADFVFGRTPAGEDPWWKGGPNWWKNGWGNRSEDNPAGGFRFTWKEDLPDTFPPYILKDVGQRTLDGNDHNFIASFAVEEDIDRISLWSASPQGTRWITNQHYLQDLNPRPETRNYSISSLYGSLFPFLHLARHKSLLPLYGAQTYGEYFQNYANQEDITTSLLDADTIEKWGYGDREKGGFGIIKPGLEDIDAKGTLDRNKNHYSRLTRLTNKFILPQGEGDPDGFDWSFGGILDALDNSGEIFGRTPETPTQYVFSQRDAFGKTPYVKNIPNVKESAPYQLIGRKYSAVQAPNLSSKNAELSELTEKIKGLTSQLTSVTEKQQNLLRQDQEALAKARMASETDGGTGTPADAAYDELLSKTPSAETRGLETEMTSLSQDIDAKLKEHYFKDQEIEEISKAYIEEKKQVYRYMNTLGMAGSYKNLITVGEPFKTDGKESTGLGLIRKNKNDESFKSIATDKINMIPYGHDNIDAGTGDKLDDFVKFKFFDIHNEKFIIFRAILSGISDAITPEWTGTKYVGRPDQVYVYSGAERKLSFNFDIYPNTKQEFPILLEKLNYLVGLCYPTFTSENRMIAPFIKLTIGDMFNGTPGFLDSLSVEVDDVSTWEVDEGLQFPKHITCNCSFTYIGKHLPSTLGKHYDLGWLRDNGWNKDNAGTFKTSDMAEPLRYKSIKHDMNPLFESLGAKSGVNTDPVQPPE